MEAKERVRGRTLLWIAIDGYVDVRARSIDDQKEVLSVN